MTVYYKMRQMLLQNMTTILLRNAAEIYYRFRQVFFLQNSTVLLQNVAVIYKLRRFYHKMRQLLQNATFITNYDITQCMKVLNDI